MTDTQADTHKCRAGSSSRLSSQHYKQDMDNCTNPVVAAVHSKQDMDNCDALTGSSVLQRLAHTGSPQSLNSRNKLRCLACPFKSSHGQLPAVDSVISLPVSVTAYNCERYCLNNRTNWVVAAVHSKQDMDNCDALGHQCCRDLLTQNHLSL